MGGGGGASCGVSANEYSCAHGAQINFGDLTPYLTYAPLPPPRLSANTARKAPFRSFLLAFLLCLERTANLSFCRGRANSSKSKNAWSSLPLLFHDTVFEHGAWYFRICTQFSWHIQNTYINHRVPTPSPLPLRVVKAGRNYLNEEILPPSPPE
jgi:hypothetical protein